MKIAGIRFTDNWRIYDFDATDVDIAAGDAVIVESDRGQGFARVVRLREGDALPPLPAPAEPKGQHPHGQKAEAKSANAEAEEEIEIEVETPGSLAAAAAAAAQAPQEKPRHPRGYRKVLRKATEEDLERDGKNHERETEALKTCRETVAERELPMKLIRAEYSFDASRVTFYFFSETRVDFRELVKDLAHKLRTRIEMRQVGVRDVARMVGGFGPCGKELCCTAFLKNFEPVSIKMAKKQDMVLNPAKISGICGRLLCCLSYEYPVYDEIKKDIASMKEAAAREKNEEKDRRDAEERREAEERRIADEKQRREQEQRRQEQKQRQAGQKEGAKGKKDVPQDQKQRRQEQPKQQQKQQPKQQQAQRPPRPQEPKEGKPQAAEQADQAGQQPGQQAEKAGGRRKRRFWRKKKGKGGGQPQGAPDGGGAPS